MAKSLYECKNCGEIREAENRCFYCNSYLSLVEDTKVFVNRINRSYKELRRKGYIKEEPTI